MSAPIEYNINITGGAAGELGKIGAGFEGADKKGHKAAEGVKAFELETDKLKTTVGGLNINLSALTSGKGSVFAFDLAEGMHAAYEVVERVVEKVVDLGKEIVKTVAKTEDLNFALKADLGEELAEKIDKLGESFQRTTRFSASQVKSALLPLAEQGIKDVALLDTLATASADLAGRRNTGYAGFQAYLGALSDITLKGGAKIKGQLKELGIKPTEYYESLGSLLNTSSKQAEALAKSGKVANETLLSTAVHLVAVREGGKGIGENAMGSAATLGGLLDRLGNVPENLFEKLGDSKAISRVKEIVGDVLDRLSGPEGADLVERFADAMGEALDGIKGQDVVGALRTAGDLVVGITKGLGLAIQLLAKLGEEADRENEGLKGGKANLGGRQMSVHYDAQDLFKAHGRAPIGDQLRALIPIFGPDDDDVAIKQLARERGIVVGEGFSDGMIEGLKQQLATLGDAGAQTAQAVHEGAKGPEGMDAHSPSRKGMWLGAMYAQGVAQGMDGESGRLALSATQSIAQTVDVRGGGGAAGGAGVVFQPGAVVIQTRSGDARGIAQEVRIEMEKLVARAALGLGVPVGGPS
jgi:hypothetical protein